MPRTLRVLGIAAVLHLGAGLAGAQRPAAQPALASYAVLGLESVRLRAGARVPVGSVGAVDGEVRLGPQVRVAGSVAAAVVRMGPGANVAGSLFCRLVTGGAIGRGVVGGPVVEGARIPGCRTLTHPLVDTSALAAVVVAPGAEDLAVPRRTGTAPMAPGRYGHVTVGAGGLLQLAGGHYEVRSVRLARRARLVCLEPCRIGVLERLLVRARGQLGAAASMRASRVRVDVAAAGGPALRAGAEAVLAATVVAPAGDLVLGRRGSYRGAYVGRAVRVGPDARVRADSAL